MAVQVLGTNVGMPMAVQDGSLGSGDKMLWLLCGLVMLPVNMPCHVAYEHAWAESKSEWN